MSNSRSRHIPAAIVRQLRDDARDRCSLRAHLLDPDALEAAAETNRLELNYVLNFHHLQHFSEGGEHTEDNLMLVCPNCHSLVHNNRDRYPISKLMFAKQHWIAMKHLIPPSLRFEGPGLQRPMAAESLTVPFALETFNLRCDLVVPRSTTVGDLAQFVGNNVLRPAVAYSRTAPFPSVLTNSRVGEVYLAFASGAYPEHVFDSDLIIGDIAGITENTLISMTDLRMVHALRMDTGGGDEPTAMETVTLNWRAAPRDLDLHFFISTDVNASHVSYRDLGTLRAFPWAQLSRDVRDGYGPETVSFGLLAHGSYRIAVHNYSRESPLAGSGATIDIEIRDTSRHFVCPAAGDGDWWLVVDFDVDSGQITELSRISHSHDI